MRVARVGLAVMKGARHRPLAAVTLSAQGPVGDRLLCLVDPRRRQVLKTVAHPRLLRAAAGWHDDELTVELDGQIVHGPAKGTGEMLQVSYWGRRIGVEVVGGRWAEPFSRLVGQAVLLARANAGDVVYGAAVSVVTTASLAGLRAAGRDGSGGAEPLDLERDTARFRATFVVDTAGSPDDRLDSEQAWVGHELVLGSARVRLTAPVVRCGVVDLHPDTGYRDRHLLDALPRSADGKPVFGLQGEVVQPGPVARGAPVHLARR